jgi:hypothetical protein
VSGQLHVPEDGVIIFGKIILVRNGNMKSTLENLEYSRPFEKK